MNPYQKINAFLFWACIISLFLCAIASGPRALEIENRKAATAPTRGQEGQYERP